MKRENKIILLVCMLIVIILIFSFSLFFLSYKKNKDIITSGNAYVAIYQYDVENFHFGKKRTLLKKIPFNKDTFYEEKIISLDNSYYNYVLIKNGIVKITDANCQNHYCMNQVIKLDSSLISDYSISCYPSGLYICLEDN